MLEDQAREIAHQILEIVPFVMRHLSAEMRQSEHFLMAPHFRLLWILNHYPYSISELANKQSVSLPTMSNSISILEERGWVTRSRSNEDRRKVLIELSPAGRAVLDDVGRHAEARIAEILKNIPESDRDVLSAGLSILREAFSSNASDLQRETR